MSDGTIKFDTETIRSMNIFEQITGVDVKDAVTNENKAYFVVEEGKAGLAIGKGGKTIKKVQENLNKDVKVFEFSDSLKEFVENIIPADVNQVRLDKGGEERVVKIKVDRRDRSRAVGKEGENVDVARRFLKREFGVDDVKVE
ncbi:MAG: NusA-like transcription termination signal-binding factor [Candidatus Nanohaloarchaea archaeon]|nr:NusA-like transcription termination signal-binding factor [Candidatus Nanohaloarchaea archaeon]